MSVLSRTNMAYSGLAVSMSEGAALIASIK